MTAAQDLDALLRAKSPAPWDVIAREIGVSPRTLADLRKGRVAVPHTATLAAIALWRGVAQKRVAAACAESRRRAQG